MGRNKTLTHTLKGVRYSAHNGLSDTGVKDPLFQRVFWRYTNLRSYEILNTGHIHSLYLLSSYQFLNCLWVNIASSKQKRQLTFLRLSTLTIICQKPQLKEDIEYYQSDAGCRYAVARCSGRVCTVCMD